jgi:mannitol/fructose-specific phosphotransferase system IIA component (Ntr-type)
VSFQTGSPDHQNRQASLEAMLDNDSVAVNVSVEDWRAAIEKAGMLLVKQGAVEAHYVDAMLRVAQELGPYIVIAPGIAMPHARPEDGVKRTAISVICLKEPIPFGHPENDPVRLVIGLAATDHTAHVKAMSQLAIFLDTPHALEALMESTTPEEVCACINRALEAERQAEEDAHDEK